MIQYHQSKGQSSEGLFSEEEDGEDRNDNDGCSGASCISEDKLVVKKTEDQIYNLVKEAVSEEDETLQALSGKGSGKQTLSLDRRMSDEETSHTTISCNLSESTDRDAAEEETEPNGATLYGKNVEEVSSTKTEKPGKLFKAVNKTKPPFSRFKRILTVVSLV